MSEPSPRDLPDRDSWTNEIPITAPAPTPSAAPTMYPNGELSGVTTVSQLVVSKIAAMAAREVSGVHSLGSGSARTLAAVRDRIPGAAGTIDPTAGVAVEVGQTQTAIDLDLVVEYGTPITDIARAVRRHVISSVEQLTGLQVVEVNITVDDVNLPTAPVAVDGSRLQ